MSGLIDRQAAIDFIDAGHLCNPNEPRWSDNEIVNFLKSRPSAHPEQISLNIIGKDKILVIKPTCLLRHEDEKKYLEEIKEQIEEGNKVVLIPSIFEIHEIFHNKEKRNETY